MSVDEELPPSKLGTKEYWDKVYEREVGVFEDTGDEGEVWFGERAMEKMRDWVYANCPPEQEEQVGSESRKRRIRAMECGCGNATLLLSLLTPPPNDDSDDENNASAPRFFPSQLTGIDYSEASIKLARGVAERRRDMWKRRVAKARKAQSGSGQNVAEDESVGAESDEDFDEEYDSDDETLSPESLQLDDPLLTTLPLFLTGDLLNFQHIRDLYASLPESHPLQAIDEINEPWDLVLDKGTFDALALSQDTIPVRRVTADGKEEVEQHLPSAVYPEKVAQLVKKGGFFLITSCNFTEQEIKSRFGKPEFGS